MKLVEVQATKEFASTFLNDIFFKMAVNRVLDAAPAVEGVTIQKWIPVTEQLPVLHLDDYEEPDGSRMQFEVSDDQWVITESGFQTKARYETGPVFQGWVGEYGETVRNVTHWMSLPEPPEVG